MTAGGGDRTLTINGSNFVTGATLTYYDPVNGKSYPGKPTNFVSIGQLVDPAFDNGGDAGSWTVTVVNPGGQSSSPFPFNVSAATPTVSGVSRNPVPGSNSTQQLTISGSNFVTGATLTYHDPVNGTSYPGRPTNSVSTGPLVDPAFDNGGDAGAWTVTVVNPGGQSSSPFPFNVTASAPSISSLSPTSYTSSKSTQTMLINGSNFQNGDTLTFAPPEGGTIASKASKLTFVSSVQLSYQFNNDGDAGPWSVTVNGADGTQQSNSVSLKVN